MATTNAQQARHYDDLLEERRASPSDMFWIAFEAGLNTSTAESDDPTQAKRHVLESIRLREAITAIAAESGGSGADTAALYRQAEAILDEMGHQFDMRAVRFLGYGLIKAFKSIYRHVWVDRQGVERLAQLGGRSEEPVVLMPSHRSYIDFLMLSFVLFSYNQRMPLIVAGIDFMAMRVIGRLLRRSGAFFIRRQFANDRLYWALFAEYVHEIMRSGRHPLEFFVEGTRARGGKPLQPKIGLLNVLAELFLKGSVYDVKFLPVDLQYERTIEERLHTRELIGGAKPPESTSGLMKALRVVQEAHGDVRVTFGPTLSMREMLGDSIERQRFGLQPIWKALTLTSNEQEAIRQMALRILVEQQNCQAAPSSVWPLMATLLLEQARRDAQHKSMKRQRRYNLSWLADQLQRLVELCQTRCGMTFAYSPSSLDAEMRRHVQVHATVLSIDGAFLTLKEDESVPCGVERMATLHLSLAHYRNQLLSKSAFVNMLFFAVARGDYARFCSLRRLLEFEFLTLKEDDRRHFDAIGGGGDELDAEEETGEFFRRILSPFIRAYYIVCRALAESGSGSGHLLQAPALQGLKPANGWFAVQDWRGHWFSEKRWQR